MPENSEIDDESDCWVPLSVPTASVLEQIFEKMIERQNAEIERLKGKDV